MPIPVTGGGGAASVAAGDITDVGAVGELLVQAATAADGRTALSLGSLATASSITASQVSDSTASGRTVLTGSASAALAAIGGTSVSSGADTSRPSASVGIIGTFYLGTDSGQLYVCESDGGGGARWRNVATGNLDATAIGVTSDSGQLKGATARANPSTGTIVLVFGGSALPGGLAHMAGNFASGIALEIGNTAGDRGLLSVYRSGSSPDRTSLTGATINGALNTAHCIAMSLTPTALRWSWDGGAVQGVVLAGTPSGTGVWNVGGNGASYTSGLYSAFRVLAEAASDADLQVLSTVNALRRIDAVASAPTIVASWYASSHAPSAFGSRLWGSQPDTIQGSVAARPVTL